MSAVVHIFSALTLWFLLHGSSLVTGKCTGKWAIHACGGGNGKRSSGNTEAGTNNYKDVLDQTLYHTLIQKLMAPSLDQSSYKADVDATTRDSDILEDAIDAYLEYIIATDVKNTPSGPIYTGSNKSLLKRIIQEYRPKISLSRNK